MRVYLTSPWIPAEWVKAHGLEPRAVWSAENFRCDAALSAGVCAFAEGVVHFAEAHPKDAVIFASSCDQLRRSFDTAASCECPRTFLFNLPATQTAAARQIYRDELLRLGKFLVHIGGVAPAPETLRRELGRANEARQRMQAEPQIFSSDRVPLALVGGPVCAAHRKIFQWIETSGGCVVLDATESGERGFCPRFALDGDPFEALVSGYFDHITDVFQRPNTRLYDWLQARLTARQVRGMVLWLFTGCDLWRAEAQSLREAFGLPVLLLEADEAAGLSPRELTRLQAFVETLK